MSYAFIAAGAWNDGLLGFDPSTLSRACELAMAVILALEIFSRAAFIKDRSPTFWTLILLDSVSILTVFPQIAYLSFLRLGRLVYASVRLTALLDPLSCRAHNPNKFAAARQLNVRTTRDIHDRVVFFDHRCWVIGQSIKDAATKKPTYMVELADPMLAPARNVYEKLWSNASNVI